ncbi:MAG: response regulator [Thermoplasmatota archaeon]
MRGIKMEILLVDDDQGFLDQAKYVLEKDDSDLEVIPLTSAKETLEYLESKEADIVISDYKMPGMDGLELLKEIRERENDIPFIIFTGKGREEIAMKALNLGADRYFKKGGDPIAQYEVLAQAIKQEVKHWQAKKESEKMRKQLKENEKRYRAIFENIGIAMVTLEKDNTISLANQRFEELSGYSQDELEGKKKWYQFVADEDVEKVKRYHDLKDVDKKLAPGSYEFKLTDKFNKQKLIYATISTLPIENKKLLSLYDFTQFEEAIYELKQLEEAFKHGDLENIEHDIFSSIEELFTKEGIKESVKDWCLEEILLLLIMNRDGASGKDLMSDLNNIFGVELSSSIVYPRLHDLEEEGLLSINEHIRTKEYLIDDEQRANVRISKKLKQFFGIYSVLKLLLSRNENKGE